MKKRTTRIVALVLSLCMAFALAACGESSSAGTGTATKSASAAPAAEASTTETKTDSASEPAAAETEAPVDDTVYNLVWAVSGSENGDSITPAFVKKVTELSNGRVTVETHFDGTLGSGNELVESILLGNIDCSFDSTANHANFVPGLAILDVPFMFNSIEELQNAMQGELGDLFEDLYAEAGLKCLGLGTRGFRWTTSNKEFTDLSSFKGLKIRTMTNSYHMAAWEALGANPTPMAFSELYLALSQGTVDAQENPLENITLNNLQEVQKYIIDTRHVAAGVGVIMSLEKWNSLPEDIQEIIQQAMDEVMSAYWDNQANLEQTSLETILDSGVEYIQLSEEQRQEMKDIAQPAVAKLVTSDLGDELAEKLFKAAGVSV